MFYQEGSVAWRGHSIGVRAVAPQVAYLLAKLGFTLWTGHWDIGGTLGLLLEY